MPSMVFAGNSDLAGSEHWLDPEAEELPPYSGVDYKILKKWQAFQQDVEALVDDSAATVTTEDCNKSGTVTKIIETGGLLGDRTRILFDNCKQSATDDANNSDKTFTLTVTGEVTTFDASLSVWGTFNIQAKNGNWSAQITEETVKNIDGKRKEGGYQVLCDGTVGGDDCTNQPIIFMAPNWCEKGINCEEVVLPEDWVNIKNHAYGNSKCVDIVNDDRLSAQNCNGSNRQKWRMIKTGDHAGILLRDVYRIENVETGQCADTAVTHINARDCIVGEDDQEWVILENRNPNKHRIKRARQDACWYAVAGSDISNSLGNCNFTSEKDFSFHLNGNENPID